MAIGVRRFHLSRGIARVQHHAQALASDRAAPGKFPRRKYDLLCLAVIGHPSETIFMERSVAIAKLGNALTQADIVHGPLECPVLGYYRVNGATSGDSDNPLKAFDFLREA